MARSQEALERRAAKRSISVDEQRLKDRKKARSESSGDKIENKGETKVRDNSSDWKCAGCSFENYSSRSACKQCKKAKDSAVTPSAAASKVIAPTAPAIFDTNDWVCPKCNNKNFAHRSVCNRCSSEKPVTAAASASASIVSSSGVPTSPVPATTASTSPAPTPRQNKKAINGVSSSGNKPQKKSNWGQNASTEKIEENKLLLELIQSDPNGSASVLSEEERQRAQILLLRKQRKAEKKIKLNKIKTIKNRKAGKSSEAKKSK